MKILHASDTHMFLWEPEEADLFLLHGDLCRMGNEKEMTQIGLWLESIKDRFEKIIIVPGNHDQLLERNRSEAEKLLKADGNKIVVMIDDYLTFRGFKIWGSPWSLRYGGWAFMRSQADMASVLEKIPQDIDFLVSHGPAAGILDYSYGVSLGCQRLRWLLDQGHWPQLKMLGSGHIHEAAGVKEHRGVFCVNPAVSGEINGIPHRGVVSVWDEVDKDLFDWWVVRSNK